MNSVSVFRESRPSEIPQLLKQSALLFYVDTYLRGLPVWYNRDKSLMAFAKEGPYRKVLNDGTFLEVDTSSSLVLQQEDLSEGRYLFAPATTQKFPNTLVSGVSNFIVFPPSDVTLSWVEDSTAPGGHGYLKAAVGNGGAVVGDAVFYTTLVDPGAGNIIDRDNFYTLEFYAKGTVNRDIGYAALDVNTLQVLHTISMASLTDEWDLFQYVFSPNYSVASGTAGVALTWQVGGASDYEVHIALPSFVEGVITPIHVPNDNTGGEVVGGGEKLYFDVGRSSVSTVRGDEGTFLVRNVAPAGFCTICKLDSVGDYAQEVLVGNDEVVFPSYPWKACGNLPAQHTADPAVVFYDNALYVIGGSRVGIALLDEAWKFNLATGEWTALASMPTARDHLGGGAYDGKIYVFMGNTGSVLGADTTVNIYDISGDSWSLGTASPQERRDHTVVQSGNKFYVLGGKQDDPEVSLLKSVDVYYPGTDTWESSPPSDMPAALSSFAAAEVGGKIYTAGGVVDRDSETTDLCYCYDPDSDTWTSIPSLPVPLGGCKGVGYDGKFFVFGGLVAGLADARGVVFCYDPGVEKWYRLAGFRFSRYFHGCVLGGSTVYLAAGSSESLTVGPLHIEKCDLDALLKTVSVDIKGESTVNVCVAYSGSRVSLYANGKHAGDIASPVSVGARYRTPDGTRLVLGGDGNFTFHGDFVFFNECLSPSLCKRLTDISR